MDVASSKKLVPPIWVIKFMDYPHSKGVSSKKLVPPIWVIKFMDYPHFKGVSPSGVSMYKWKWMKMDESG